MLKKLLTISLFTFSLSNSVFASVPQEASIKQAIKLADINETLTETIKATSATFNEQAALMVKRRTGHTTPTVQDTDAAHKISQIMSQNITDMMQALDINKLTEDAFRKYYTEEELQVYIKFLSSPEGQSINKKSPILVQDIMKSFSNTFQNNIELKEKMKASNNEMQAILKSLPKAEKVAATEK
ncbi:DUF2059 domain-containing protein [Acinetobacter nectaris]|uniref:DUF2059 domain-containing protein n=1 Tax=Acinetobacter nectaris TaxID=1219382 RepID=UPI001F43FF81|nr:DUF2059 domain-containing protein [Acinetobacter nectaris]MCF9033432.1 DUF2059 domain-containing protein [Acinetobacter nectaris]